jgi:hypothetical protein
MAAIVDRDFEDVRLLVEGDVGGLGLGHQMVSDTAFSDGTANAGLLSQTNNKSVSDTI